MKRIITILLLMFTVNAFAAGQQYYNYPAATGLPDNGRILMYDGSSSKNITGSKLKSEVLGGAGPLVKQAPSTATTGYERQMEIRDRTGKIVMWFNARGQQIFGTPAALSIVAVYPANGATGVAKSIIPYVQFNKSTVVDISTAYIQGNSTPPANDTTYGFDNVGIKWGWPLALTANTTYTIKILRGSIQQTDGETTSSCGSAMTDIAGICTSTFTTGQ